MTESYEHARFGKTKDTNEKRTQANEQELTKTTTLTQTRYRNERATQRKQ